MSLRVHCVAVVHTLHCLTQPAHHREVKDLRDVLLTNVVGTYMVTKAFLPLIRKGHKKQVRAVLLLPTSNRLPCPLHFWRGHLPILMHQCGCRSSTSPQPSGPSAKCKRALTPQRIPSLPRSRTSIWHTAAARLPSTCVSEPSLPSGTA